MATEATLEPRRPLQEFRDCGLSKKSLRSPTPKYKSEDERQMIHHVKTLRKLKWYILSERLENSSDISGRNAEETQVVHPIETLRTEVVHPGKNVVPLEFPVRL